MGLFGNLSVVFLVGLVVDVIGFILHVVGLATPNWTVFSISNRGVTLDQTFGLFKYCEQSNCADYPDAFDTDSVKAAAAMSLIGILLAIGGIIAAIVYIIKRSLSVLVKVAGALSVAAFIFVIIGVIVWGADVHKKLPGDIGFSLGLSTAGAILFLIAGVLLLADKTFINVS